jgi:alpha-glucosidase (family GH31 glycosyl hydrolase)
VQWQTQNAAACAALHTAVHADGTTEYDAHNLYGTTMAMRFHEAFTGITGKRPFILSRCAGTEVHETWC